jgi:hypothetical protein
MAVAGWKASLGSLLGAMAARPPAAGAAVELLDRWSGELYRPDAPLFKRQFSAAELGRLKRFDAFLVARRADLLATAGEVPSSAAWREVAAEAASVLADLGWRGGI